MADVQVKCINKRDRTSQFEGITHLGGDSWKWTRSQVIKSIEDKTNTFYTRVNGNRSDIAVVNGRNGKYVQTHADGKWNNNLLALMECIS